MKKNIIAMAVAAAVAAPVAAMADTTLYGKIHASYDLFGGDAPGGDDYTLSSNSSRLGIKGKEGISDNLSFIYQWETTLDFGGRNDTPTGGLGGGRNTFIGFTGDFGTVIAGRHDTPFKGVSRKYDLFGDTVGDSRNIVQGVRTNGSADDTGTWGGNDTAWDLRTNNTVAYVTPDLGGFHAKIAYVSDWEENGNNAFDAYSMSAGYEVAGFMVDAAYEVHNTDGTAGFGDSDEQTGMRLGAGYKMGGFKVVGLYQNLDNIAYSDADVDMWGVGGAYSFGKSTIKAQYYTADDIDGFNDSGADLWAVGYDYKLSKQTSVYAAYAQTDNDANALYAVGNGGHGTGEGYRWDAANENGGGESSAISVGLVHKF